MAIEGAEQWTLRSSADRTFEVSLARPRGGPPEGGYPVIYVLDPSTSFCTLTEVARMNELMYGPVLVVGVGYPSDAEVANRNYDLSPDTDPKTLPEGPPQGWGAVGGADAFLAFLQNDLKPALESYLTIDKDRQALFGHSLGGLFALHVLFTHSECFETYVAASPAIWWGHGGILRQLPAFKRAQAQRTLARRLLVTVGELEHATSREEQRMADRLNFRNLDALMREANMVGNATSLLEELKPLMAHCLQVEYAVFAGETHNSVIPAYLSRGARFTLAGWFK